MAKFICVNFHSHGANKRFKYRTIKEREQAVQKAIEYIFELMGPDWDPWQNISGLEAEVNVQGDPVFTQVC